MIDILYNARIYTQDAHNPVVSALVIDRGTILAAGEAQNLRSAFEGRATEQDLGGRVVIPGLIDAHIHLQHYALSLKKLDCETDTRQECLHRVAERARQQPPGTWILGHGWNQNQWEDGFGRAIDLDRVAPEHPVYLTAKSLHAAWANSVALHQANLTAATLDPPGGRLGRDAFGEPDGILFEAAMNLVAERVPEPSLEAVREAILQAQPVLWQVGLTGVHDFDRSQCFQALQSLHQARELKLRVLKSIPVETLEHAIAVGLRSGFGDDFLRIGAVKAFADGALGPQTAAMLEPYEGSPENRGMLMLDAEQLYETARLAAENGLSMAVHAIGDRANHEVLNAFEQLHREGPARKSNAGRLRQRIEHVQLLHPQDAARLAQLDIIASMQPIHATSDMLMADRFWGERSTLAYAWRTQLDHGAVLAFGSDAPVESPNPFWGLYAAVSRRRADGSPGSQGWYPQQRLAIDQALQAYTTGAAYAAGLEDRQGRLAPGYWADLLLLELDPFTCDAEQLRAIQPLGTMVAGEWVWRQV